MDLNQGGKDLLNTIKRQKQAFTNNFNPSNFFQVRTMNEVIEEAKQQEVPNMLFSELWFEQEICLFFAGSNTGKSIIAIQIADSISRGEAIEGFKLESPAQKVLYIDYELQPKQLEKRYSEHYKLFQNRLFSSSISLLGFP
ncbi:MAG: AAA family ATPase [Saprospiraceae bacterium]|nr:AAA family ATPase [Saprospiraceae bacterium]